MLQWVKNLFSKGSPADHEALAERWYGEKSDLMEHMLGKEHDMVLHAIIPYRAGGGLDLYYYPNFAEGVGIATKELKCRLRMLRTRHVYEA